MTLVYSDGLWIFTTPFISRSTTQSIETIRSKIGNSTKRSFGKVRHSLENYKRMLSDFSLSPQLPVYEGRPTYSGDFWTAGPWNSTHRTSGRQRDWDHHRDSPNLALPFQVPVDRNYNHNFNLSRSKGGSPDPGDGNNLKQWLILSPDSRSKLSSTRKALRAPFL